MPTNEGGNGASPTTASVNAQVLDVTSLTPEQLEAHPHFQELAKKYTAAHQDMDKTNLSRKELLAENARLKVLAGEEETVVPEEKPLTRKELEQMNVEMRFDLLNAKDLELYGDEKFKADLQSGIPKAYALENAKLRYQASPDKVRLERQQVMASGIAVGVRNLDSDELTPTEQKGIAEGLYSKETALLHRELKKQRGQ